jgi:hypothetical protein
MRPDSEGLHPIANTAKQDRKADVVFIHGLGGRSHATWRHGKLGSSDHFFWPEELGKDLENCGIWTIGYPAGFTAMGKPGMIIEKRAGNLSHKLVTQGLGALPLVFICHSMGGLIVKSLIVDSQTEADSERKSLVNAVHGIVFCGTPHRGSAFADAVGILGKALGGSQKHVDQMCANDERLDLLHSKFIEWQSVHAVPVQSYAESVGLLRTRWFRRPLPLGLVVPRTSANPGIAGYSVKDVDDDHLTIVKPSTRDHDVYAGVLQFIRDRLSVATVDFPALNSRTYGSGSRHGAALSKCIELWITEAEFARSTNTLSAGNLPPTSLVEARNKFESAWRQAALAERKFQDPEKTFKALSYLNRLYRIVEHDSSSQQNANFWADESIRFFEEIQNKKYLTEALLDKAAIYLDIAQLGHNDKPQFDAMANNGSAVMAKAYQTASEEQRPSVLRITSRFYYSLARPKSFRLSENWDNNYLLLSYQKAKLAYELAPTDSKNANQLARTVIKSSKNPPQDSDNEWTMLLRDSQQKLRKAWIANQSTLVGLDQRLSPLNVLGVATLEAVAREWSSQTQSTRMSKAASYIAEIDSDAIAPLREAAALLQNSALRKSYGFDLYYDVARAQALKTAVMRTFSVQRADKEFQELRANLLIAKENAKTSQLEAAVKDLATEITFTMLTQEERNSLLDTLSIVK